MKSTAVIVILSLLLTDPCSGRKDSESVKKSKWVQKSGKLNSDNNENVEQEYRWTNNTENLNSENETDLHLGEKFHEFAYSDEDLGHGNIDQDPNDSYDPPNVFVDADHSAISSNWDLFDEEEEDSPIIDDDQGLGAHDLDVPHMDDEESYNRQYIMESSDTADYEDIAEEAEDLEMREDWIPTSDQDSTDLTQSFVSPTESSIALECNERGIKKKGRSVNKKNKKKKKHSASHVLLIRPGKSKSGRSKSKWKQNCCIRGKKVGLSRRTFLSKNLFQECKERSRSLGSRMSRACKWIFWNCCETKALRQYYVHTVKKIQSCS